MIKLREIPGIAEFEKLCSMHNLDQMMKDEREAFPSQWDEISIRLFGIQYEDTFFDYLPAEARTAGEDEWDAHFRFLEWVYEEEGSFWSAVGVDVTDGHGEDLICMLYLGRQMVCAIKGLHPNAKPTFLTGEQSDDQLMAAAEKWAESLGAP